MISVRPSLLEDAEKAARLHVFEKDMSWQILLSVFEKEFSLCLKHPELRTYFMAFANDELVSYAGARFYNQQTDENMYGTTALLPTGWYLRGIKVHPDWRRQGLARQMTQQRINWISKRSKTVSVFLDDENKVSLPMYYELGFVEKSRGWTFTEPYRIAQGTRGILLELFL
jgi:GNAT superfamily N-acetyltransferase